MSTSGVVFLGCPHRATEHSTLADAIKSMAAITFRVDSQDLVLEHLSGASSAEAELGRQAFVRIWNDYNFKVKTFQESIVPSYRFLELRAEAVSDLSPSPALHKLIESDRSTSCKLPR